MKKINSSNKLVIALDYTQNFSPITKRSIFKLDMEDLAALTSALTSGLTRTSKLPVYLDSTVGISHSAVGPVGRVCPVITAKVFSRVF